MGKKLVVYFTAEGGRTEALARNVAAAAKADLRELTPTEPYTQDDLYWPNAGCRSVVEMKTPGFFQPMKPLDVNPGDYDVIFVGFPVWCGTAPTAHACANTSSPAAQGVWGILEVFVDTILLCTLTALVILVNGEVAAPYAASPVMMTAAAFSATLGRGAAWFLSVAVLCFGYATVVCWADYGAANLRFLGRRGERFKNVYYAVFAVCIPLGCALAPGAVWAVSDFAMTALTAINLFGMVRLRKEVREETDRRFGLFQPKKGEQRNSRHGQDQARTPGQEPAGQPAQAVQAERDAAKARGMVQ